MDEDEYEYQDCGDDVGATQTSVVVPDSTPVIPIMLERLGFGHVSTRDDITLKYDGRAKTLKAVVKRHNGVTQTVTRSMAAGFRGMTEFDPNEIESLEARNHHICALYEAGATQQTLAEKFGLSQPMIHRIVKGK